RRDGFELGDRRLPFGHANSAMRERLPALGLVKLIARAEAISLALDDLRPIHNGAPGPVADIDVLHAEFQEHGDRGRLSLSLARPRLWIGRFGPLPGKGGDESHDGERRDEEKLALHDGILQGAAMLTAESARGKREVEKARTYVRSASGAWPQTRHARA